MQDNPANNYSAAIQDFRRIRNQADLKELLSRLTGESTQLLSFNDARQMLRMQGFAERGLLDIPLDAIVGSVGRYTDFTRGFLPRREVNPERWARVKVVASGLVGLPPIDVYKIGEAYFVLDGNHRVSVARALGATHIQAYVTEVKTRVPLTPDDRLDDLIIKGEYASFLEQTRLDELRPAADLQVTSPGQYPILIEHIDVHRYYMGLDMKRHVPYSEAVAHWYDHIYLPVVEIIHKQGILRDFPGRTEADLYLWIARHRAELFEQLGWNMQIEHIASHLSEQHSPARGGVLGRVSELLLDAILPEALESGPPVGNWRTKAVSNRPDDRLFIDVLVPVNGQQDGWCALEQALTLAEREGAALHGLYVVGSQADKTTQETRAVQDEFTQRCAQASVKANLTLAVGEIADQICLHAAWTDLVVVNVSYPPGDQPLARLSSGFRDLIQRSPRPVLATPRAISPLSRALLAYDASPKSQEALYVATYLAGQWKIPLTVLSVKDDGSVTAETIEHARSYLEGHAIQANYLLEDGPTPEAIMQAAEAQRADLLIMGGYGFNPLLEVMLGSAVDHVLRASDVPTLICR
ncbi:MAG: universal stress protein [Anaerolineales bacterium]|nr:universal stress protein [Anaerolineales bacterium]